MLADVEGGRVVGTRPNPAAGRWILPCSRGLALADGHNSPDRLRRPLVRTGRRGAPSWREAGWDEALGIVAERLGEVVARSGPDSVLAMAGAGSLGALQSTPSLTRRFLSLAGGYTALGGSYSNGAAKAVLPYLLGPGWEVSGFDPATMEKSGMVILWGANILEARLGSELPARLLEAKRRGTAVVVIDPRRTVTAERAATWHLPILPGTDTALMLALLHVLLAEGLADRGWAEARSVGFGPLADYVLGAADGIVRGPEWAQPICGVAAGDTRRLAREWAAAKPAMLLPGYSIQRVLGGEEPYRLAVALQLATGNFGQPGGSTGSMNNLLPNPRVGVIDPLDRPGRPRLPVLHWPDAILEGRPGGYPTDIAAAVVAGCNWLGQGADARKSAAAFDALGFSVCLDLFPTPTAMRCDVVLPVASALEKEDIGIPWHGNWLAYKPRALPPAGLARDDYDILSELAARMGFGDAFTEHRSGPQWIERFIAESEVADPEEFRRTGVYIAPDQERIGLAEFAADPVGHPLGTPSGRVELCSGAWARDTGGTALPAWTGGAVAGVGVAAAAGVLPLLLVSPKAAHRTHSQGGDPKTVAGSGGHFVEMHPGDAAARGVADGDEVRLSNKLGTVRARARVTDSVMPGVVSLAEGVWLPSDTGDYEGSGSPNLLCSTLDHGPSHSVIMHGIRVEARRA
jgi:molybdopterin guanine dinucleotide-containing S/N-oxide reductase-like protein